jgi:hypothetical protein
MKGGPVGRPLLLLERDETICSLKISSGPDATQAAD